MWAISSLSSRNTLSVVWIAYRANGDIETLQLFLVWCFFFYTPKLFALGVFFLGNFFNELKCFKLKNKKNIALTVVLKYRDIFWCGILFLAIKTFRARCIFPFFTRK